VQNSLHEKIILKSNVLHRSTREPARNFFQTIFMLLAQMLTLLFHTGPRVDPRETFNIEIWWTFGKSFTWVHGWTRAKVLVGFEYNQPT